jgi:hypothetical protein
MKPYILAILALSSIPSVALAGTVGDRSVAGPWTDIELSIGADASDHCDAIGYDDMVDVNLNRNGSWMKTDIYMCMDRDLKWIDQHQVDRPIADLRLIIDGWNAFGGSSDDELCQDLGEDYFQVGGFYEHQDYDPVFGVVPDGSPYFVHDKGDLNSTTSWGDDYVYLCAHQPTNSTYILDRVYVAASGDKDEAKDACSSDGSVSVPGYDNDWDPLGWVDLNHDAGGDFIYMCRTRVGRDTINLEQRRTFDFADGEGWFNIPRPVRIGHNTSDHIRLDSDLFDNLSSFTIAMALELESVPQSHSLRTLLSISRHDQNNHLILEYYDSDETLRLTLHNITYVLGSVSLTPGHKHTVAVTKSGNSASAYVDGVLIGSTPVGAFTLDPTNSGIVGETIVGQEQDTMGGGFDPNQSLGGVVYGVSITGSALNPAQVSAAEGGWRAGFGAGTTLDHGFVNGVSGVGWTEIDEGVTGNWTWFPFDLGLDLGLVQGNNAGAYGPLAADGHTPWLGTGQVSDLWMDKGRFDVELVNHDDDGIGILY